MFPCFFNLQISLAPAILWWLFLPEFKILYILHILISFYYTQCLSNCWAHRTFIDSVINLIFWSDWALTGKTPEAAPHSLRLKGSREVGGARALYHYHRLVWKGEFGISFLVNCVLTLLWDLGLRESNLGLSQDLFSDHRISWLAVSYGCFPRPQVPDHLQKTPMAQW